MNAIKNSSPDYAGVATAVHDLITDLQHRVDESSVEIERRKKHFGAEYHRLVVAYTKKINKLEREYSPRIEVAGAQIGELAGEDWPNRREIVTLWHQLATAVTAFSEHPNKKVATLIIDPGNRLQAFSANRVPPGIRRNGHHYLKGKRKNYIVCSERLAIARLLELKIRPTRLGKLRSNEYCRLMREQVGTFSDSIAIVGKTSDVLRGSYILSTTTPCKNCREVIAPFRPLGVYGDSRAGSNYTRDVSFAAAQAQLAVQGINLIDLAL